MLKVRFDAKSADTTKKKTKIAVICGIGKVTAVLKSICSFPHTLIKILIDYNDQQISN